MKFLSLLLSATALANVVYAALNITELLTDTPKCALSCVLSGITKYNCSLPTFDACLCPNIPMQSELSTCVQTSCKFQDQVLAVDVEAGICANYPKESRSSEVRRVAIILSAVTYPIVALRCFARWNVTRQIWYDDWAALVATFFLMVLGGIEIYSSGIGFGNHYWNVGVFDGEILLKLFYVVQMSYVLIQVFAKVSILLLYYRVFPRPWFKWACRIFMAFLFCHGLSYLLVLVFQCSPISSIWDRSVTGTCVNLTVVGYSGAIFSIVEDFVILVLPISELNTLSFGIRKRVSLMLMFSIGSFACVTSMVRLKYIIAFGNSYDSTWDNVDVVIWSMIEEHTAVICACLPSLRPLLVQWIPGVFRSLTTKNNTGGSGSFRLSPWRRRQESYSGLGNSRSEMEHIRQDSKTNIIPHSEKASHGVVMDEEMADMDWQKHHIKKETRVVIDHCQIPPEEPWTQIPRSVSERDLPGRAM